MSRFPGLVGGSLKSRSPIADCEETWNWYVEQVESPNAKATPVLYPAPGFVGWASFYESPIRGVWSQGNRLFAAVQDRWYEVNRDGSTMYRPPTQVPTPAMPTVTISTPTQPLSQMSPPVLYANGTQGTSTYGYKVTALNVLGETLASLEGITQRGNVQLSTINYILVTWQLVANATGYKVYRTTGTAGVPRLLTTIQNPTQTTFQDNGDQGESKTPPTSNTTGSPSPNTTWGYKIVATNLTGKTLPSVEGTVQGYPVLSAQHVNTITWTEVPNCTGYEVYRTTAPAITSPGVPGLSDPPDPLKPSIPANQLVLLATLVGSDKTTVQDKGFLPGINDPAPTLPTANTTLASGLPGSPSLVSICSSGDAGREIFICAGGKGFIYDLDTNSLTAVVNDVTQGGFIDGYFVGLDTNSSTLKISNYLDGLVWDASQAAQRNVAGDKWQSMLVAHREIWLFGEQTTEVWVNVGSSPFPFAPNPNVFIEVGSGALNTAVRVAGELIWYGQTAQGGGVVYQANGYTPERVSNHALETALQSYAYTADAEAFGYEQEGHVFYVLTFPTANATWVYDLTTKLWSRRGVWTATANRYDCFRPNCHCFYPVSNLHLVGDRKGFGNYYEGGQGSVLCAMMPQFGHDIVGGYMRRMRRAPHLHAELTSVAYRRLQVDMEVGLARSGVAEDPLLNYYHNGLGDDPTLMLRWSDDGGKTWSNEHWTTAGKIGEYRKRVRWSRLGAARDRVFELVCTDPVPWRIIDADLAVEQAAF